MIANSKFLRKSAFLLVLISSFLSALQLFSQNTETLTITTYYPSPTGVYQNLRLFPIAAAQAPICNTDQEGTMYYNNDAGQKQLMVCRETAVGVYGWQAVGASFWTQTGNDLYPNDTTTPWEVGIGTTSPARELHIANNVSAEMVLEQSNAKTDYKRWNFVVDGGDPATESNFYIRQLNDTGTNGNIPLYINGATGVVGIGTTNPQAKLDVNSTTSGFLPPRMNTTQRSAISPLVAGMVIYNTDSTNKRLELYNGSSWVGVGGTLKCVTVSKHCPTSSPCTATCDAGYTLTGGGIYTYYGSNVDMNRPISDTTWQVHDIDQYNHPNSIFYAYARCCKIE
ncbi:MAG: hypothetical protein WC412_04280 [Candidatus Omnitrophota bacterium]|jgi:hypothetical protein